MIWNDAGKMVMQCWIDIPQHYQNVVLHEFVIMPNHIHGIIEIANDGTVEEQPTSNRIDALVSNIAKKTCFSDKEKYYMKYVSYNKQQTPFTNYFSVLCK
jgi:REP element-mobilizing transposase RayT